MKTIAFRADASPVIGAGHVMRCLSLALAFSEQGLSIMFCCARLPEKLQSRIKAAGFRVILAEEEAAATPPAADHVPSPGDADMWARVMRREQVDLLVVDHYAIDSVWESELRTAVPSIMVIDDLADRRHDCDFLLDQNIIRHASHYRQLVPPSTAILVGPDFALLRDEFSQQRSASLGRIRPEFPRTILISMGGSDSRNDSCAVLDALASACLPAETQVTVLLGPMAPYLEEVRTLLANCRFGTRLLVDVHDLAELLVETDLVIGACGSSVWERCCLGIPSVILVLADNQREVARHLHEISVATLLEQEGNLLPDAFRVYFDGLRADPGFLARQGARAAQICDGQGARRLVAALNNSGVKMADEINLRLATLDDVDAEYCEWYKNSDGHLDHFTGSGRVFTKEWLQDDLSAGLRNETHYYYVIEHSSGKRIGTVKIGQIDRKNKTSDLVCLLGDRNFAGRGLATVAIRIANGIAFEKYGIRRLQGGMYAGNIPSIKAYTKAGWQIEATMKGFYLRNGEAEDRVCVVCFNPEFFN